MLRNPTEFDEGILNLVGAMDAAIWLMGSLGARPKIQKRFTPTVLRLPRALGAFRSRPVSGAG